MPSSQRGHRQPVQSQRNVEQIRNPFLSFEASQAEYPQNQQLFPQGNFADQYEEQNPHYQQEELFGRQEAPEMGDRSRQDDRIRQKQEEYRMQLDQQIQLKNSQHPTQTLNQGNPSSHVTTDVKAGANSLRAKREEYKKELDAQLRQKQYFESQISNIAAFNSQGIEQMPLKNFVDASLQKNYTENQAYEGLNAIPRQQNLQIASNIRTTSQQGFRPRTDITQERKLESEIELQKKLTYQEELRLQMKQAQQLKEAEKARLKREDQEYEERVLRERVQLEKGEKQELIKEGKSNMKLDDNKPMRQVNRSLFETSEQIAAKKTQQQTPEDLQDQRSQLSNINLDKKQQIFRSDKINSDQNTNQPVYQPFQLPPAASINYQITQNANVQDSHFIPSVNQGVSNNDALGQGPHQYGIDMDQKSYHQNDLRISYNNFQPIGLPQTYSHIQQQVPHLPFKQQIQSVQIQNADQNQQLLQHKQLLEDQQKMIAMYQQALQQILDFRTQYFKEAMDMQTNLMKEREQLYGQFQMNQKQPTLYGKGNHEDYSKQAQEIQQLEAVNNQLGHMMSKARLNGDDINPKSLEDNLTQILNPQVQNGLNTLIKTQRDQIQRISQSLSFRDDPMPIRGYEDNQGMDFDASLDSKSKLISVPNQFTNKLKEKAEGFEQQRLINQQSPVKQPQPAQESEGQNTSPVNRQTNLSNGLYQTWIQGSATSPQEVLQRQTGKVAAKMSVNKINGPQEITELSQFDNQGYQFGQSALNQNQKRVFSPIPHQNIAQALSPSAYRPQTNLHPAEVIEELPEREQNLDNTGDYSEECGRAFDQRANINQNLESGQRKTNVMDNQTTRNKTQKISKIGHSIETDHDFNCRDDEISQYSKSIHGGKSKVSQLVRENLERTNDYQAKIQKDRGEKVKGLGSNNKSPFSSAIQRERNSGAMMSPDVSGSRMINIAQLSGVYGHHKVSGSKPQIPMSTEKSFYKPQVNLNSSNMANTGMQGAPKVSQTGSSFYNATMAKTRIQEQNQQEELQKQLMKIYRQEEENKSQTTINDKEAQAPNENNYVSGFHLVNDSIGEIENMSNINIAQSVAYSFDVGRIAHNDKNQVHYEQQYAWLMKNNQPNQQSLALQNSTINEQEHDSKSRTNTSRPQTQLIDKSLTDQPSVSQKQSQPAQLNQQKIYEVGVKQIQPNKLQGIANNIKNELTEKFSKNQNSYEGDDFIADEDQQFLQFEHTVSSIQNHDFEVIQETGENKSRKYNSSAYQNNDWQQDSKAVKNQCIGALNSKLDQSAQGYQFEKPGTAAQPYQFEVQTDHGEDEFGQSQFDQADCYNIGLNEEEQISNQENTEQEQEIKLKQKGLYKPHRELGSRILDSNDQDPSTSQIVVQDRELMKLQMCSPGKNIFTTTSDKDQQEKDFNEKIEQAYEKQTQSNQFRLTLQKTLPLEPKTEQTVKYGLQDTDNTKFLNKNILMTGTKKYAGQKFQFSNDQEGASPSISTVNSDLFQNDRKIIHEKDTYKQEVTSFSVADQNKNISERIVSRIDEELLQDKLDKIKNIFNQDRIQQLNDQLKGKESIQTTEYHNLLDSESHRIHRLEDQKTPKTNQAPCVLKPNNTPVKDRMQAGPQNAGQARPLTNVSDKHRELQELAKLIQAATGSVGLALESSQNSTQLKFKAQKTITSALNKLDTDTKTTKVRQISANRTQADVNGFSTIQHPITNLKHIAQVINQQNNQDTQIINELDISYQTQNIIKNSRASSLNTNIIKMSKKLDEKLDDQNDQEIIESINLGINKKELSPLKAELIYNQKFRIIQEENVLIQNNNMNMQGEDSISKNEREAIIMKIENKSIGTKIQRPISSKSQNSLSTNRYNAANNAQGSANKAGLQKNYEQFRDEEED